MEEEERRKREKLKPKIDQSRAVNQEAIEKILERRKREAHQQKQLELKRKKLAGASMFNFIVLFTLTFSVR